MRNKTMTKEELEILEGLLNEEILSCLQSGYDINSKYVITMRGMLKRHGLKEYYKFNDYGESDE